MENQTNNQITCWNDIPGNTKQEKIEKLKLMSISSIKKISNIIAFSMDYADNVRVFFYSILRIRLIELLVGMGNPVKEQFTLKTYKKFLSKTILQEDPEKAKLIFEIIALLKLIDTQRDEKVFVSCLPELKTWVERHMPKKLHTLIDANFVFQLKGKYNSVIDGPEFYPTQSIDKISKRNQKLLSFICEVGKMEFTGHKKFFVKKGAYNPKDSKVQIEVLAEA